MDPSPITAIAALLGADIGGLTSVLASWLTQPTQVRASWVAQDIFAAMHLQFNENQQRAFFFDF
jgi:hypothetical protein